MQPVLFLGSNPLCLLHGVLLTILKVERRERQPFLLVQWINMAHTRTHLLSHPLRHILEDLSLCVWVSEFVAHLLLEPICPLFYGMNSPKASNKIFSHQNNGHEGPRFIPAMLANRFVNSDWQYLKKYTLHIIASHRTIYIDLLRCCMYHCFNTKGHHLILRSLLPEFSVSFGQLDGHHWSTKKQERSKIWGSTWLDGCRIAICPKCHVETLSNRNIYILADPPGKASQVQQILI